MNKIKSLLVIAFIFGYAVAASATITKVKQQPTCPYGYHYDSTTGTCVK
jgi:hypothetical protein